MARPGVEQAPLDVDRADDGEVADPDELVAGPQPRGLRRAAALDLRDHHAPPVAALLLDGDHAVPGGGQPPRAQQLGRDPLDLVDRQGEADPLRPGAHRHVDPDQLPFDVDQRPTRIPGVDAGVGLDQVAVDLVVGERDVAVQGADDPHRDRVLVAEGVADRDHRLAHHQVGGDAQLDRRRADAAGSILRIARSITASNWRSRAGQLVPSNNWTMIPWTLSTT